MPKVFKDTLKAYNYLIALIMRWVRRSARRFCRSITAHIAAGSQPISVHCNSRHITALNIRPLMRKDKEGNNMAISIIIVTKLKKVFETG